MKRKGKKGNEGKDEKEIEQWIFTKVCVEIHVPSFPAADVNTGGNTLLGCET